jgi:hypothetical protein
MGRVALTLSTLAVGMFVALPALATAVSPLPRIPADAGPAAAVSLKVKPGQIVLESGRQPLLRRRSGGQLEHSLEDVDDRERHSLGQVHDFVCSRLCPGDLPRTIAG